MKIVLKNLKASDKVKTMYKKGGGGINKLPKDSWKKGEDYYPPSSEMEEGGYGKKKKPSTKGGRPKPIPVITGPKASKRKPTTEEKREFIYSPAAKDFRRGRPTSQKSKKAIKKSVEALPKVKQRKKKTGGKIQYRSIGGRTSRS